MKPLQILSIVCLSFILFSCSDKLSEAKAEKLIKERVSFPQTNELEIEYGLIAFDQDSLPGYYYILQKEGMFKIESLGSGGLFVISHRFRVSLTPERKKYLPEEDKNPLKQGDTGEFMYRSKFRTCELEFVKVESIQEIPAYNAADIIYTAKRQNFTPFWKYYLDEPKKMPDTIQERKFSVIKTNDGWKPAR